jgi:hypothetical protein
VVLAVLGGCFTWNTVQFLTRSIVTTGTIVRMNSKTDAKGRTSWTPVFAYRAADGHLWTLTSHMASMPPEYIVGESIRVRYEPAHPGDGRIDSALHLWMAPAVLFFLAGITFAMHRAKMLLVTRFRKRGEKTISSGSEAGPTP